MSVSSFVESIEYVEFSVGSTATSVSTNLTKGQNYANCVPFFTSHSTGEYYDCKFFDVYFSGTTESGVLNARRWDQRSNTANVKCYVVEFNPDEIRVQQGTFSVTSAATHTVTLPITLSGVDKTAMVFSSRASSDYQYISPHAVRGRVVDTTSIDFYRNNVTGSCDGHWFLFEDMGNNFKVSHGDGSFTSSAQDFIYSGQETIDHLRAFFICSFASSNVTAGYVNRETCRAYLLGESIIRFDKDDVNYTIYYAFQVIEFLDKTKIYTPLEIDTPQGIGAGSTTTTRDFSLNSDTRVLPMFNADTSTPICGMVQGLAKINTSVAAAIDETFTSVKVLASGIVYEKCDVGYTNSNTSCIVVDWAGITVDTGINTDPVIPEGNAPGQSFVKSVENFRFTMEDYFGARPLSKGQAWENCVTFCTFRGTGTYDYLHYHLTKVWLVSPGIVCFKHWYSGGYQIYVDVSVVEFYPSQVKVQHLNVETKGAVTTNVAIEGVSNINKCFIVSNFMSSNNHQYPSTQFFRASFTSTTNVELYKYTASANESMPVSLFVVEDLGDNFTTAHYTTSITNVLSMFRDDSWLANTYFILISYAADTTTTYPGRMFIKAYQQYEHYPVYGDRSDSSNTFYCYVTLVGFNDRRIHTSGVWSTFTAGVSTVTTTYSSLFSEHSHALTIVPPVMTSTMRSDTSAAAGITEGFVTARITDYETYTVELSKTGSTYVTQGAYQVVDWIGYHYQDSNNIIQNSLTPTRSVVNSIQKENFSGSTYGHYIYLTKGQNINQCVPFLSSSIYSSDGSVRRLYPGIFRKSDPDSFFVRPGTSSVSSINLLLYIVEFGDRVKVQYGSGYTSGTTKTFTTSFQEVVLSKAFLVFYTFTNSSRTYTSASKVCGYFSSSSELTFNRYNADDWIYITWYVVECIDDSDLWTVQHLYRTTVGEAADAYATLTYIPDYRKSMLLASISAATDTTYPSYALYRAYHRQDELIQFSKSNATGGITDMNVDVIEMSDIVRTLGFKAASDFITFSAGTSSTNFDLVARGAFNTDRSMILSSALLTGESRLDTSTATYVGEAYVKYDFVDSDTISLSRTSSNAVAYCFPYIYQWPEYNKYYMEGWVSEMGEPVSRQVIAFRSSTKEIIDKTMSVSGTGYFFLETPFYEEHDVVCYDDNVGLNFNHLIYKNILPITISGTFAYNQGLTVSGVAEGIPIGRL